MDDRAYRVQATGTFLCTRTGSLDLEVWRAISTALSKQISSGIAAQDIATGGNPPAAVLCNQSAIA